MKTRLLQGELSVETNIEECFVEETLTAVRSLGPEGC